MKKLIFLLLLNIFLSLPSFSQPFTGGFFAGFTASQVDGDTYSGFDKPGITAGGYIASAFPRYRDLDWKAELRYIQKGASKKTSIDDPDYYRLKIHYVEIPFMIQYTYREKFYLETGLSPDIYLGHREEDEYGVVPEEAGPAYHRFGLNAHAGGGYFLSRYISAGIRYSYSAIPMRDHASGQTYLLNRGQYNNVLGLSLYYHFR